MIIKNWLIPIIVAALLFVAIRPTFAQVIKQQANLAQYLTINNVEVGEEAVDGFTQIYYVFAGEKTFITEGGLTSRQPHTNGEYITFVKDINGAGQIFLYHISSGSTVQLTNSGTNLNPDVDRKGNVVWEGWVGDRWQMFLFDGKSVFQITDGDVSVNADIEDDFIAYTRQDISGTWRAVIYSISKKETQDVSTGIKSKKPKIEGRKIILEGEGKREEFPLTIDDLFLLNLSPLSSTPTPSPEPEAPETVTEADIIEELSATPSAELDSTQTLESSSSGQSEATPTPAP